MLKNKTKYTISNLIYLWANSVHALSINEQEQDWLAGNQNYVSGKGNIFSCRLSTSSMNLNVNNLTRRASLIQSRFNNYTTYILTSSSPEYAYNLPHVVSQSSVIISCKFY